MKIFERTLDNMDVLRDCVDILIDRMPWIIPANETIGFHGYDIGGLGRVQHKYAATPYKNPLEKLSHATFVFKNLERYTDSSTYGAYLGEPERVFIFNVSGFMGSAEAVSKNALLAFRRANPASTFRGVLLHELRHFFQSFLYRQFFDKPEAREYYKKSPIEIDAAWSHHLEDNNVADYSSANSYANAVMASFAAYKTLTRQQYQHYWRKTARYYLEERQREAPVFSVKQHLLQSLASLDNDFDLRKIPGYDRDARMFLLPFRTIKGCQGIIAADKQVSRPQSPVLFLTVALVTPPSQAASVLKYLMQTQKVTLNTVLSYTANAFTNQWDITAINNFIANRFGRPR